MKHHNIRFSFLAVAAGAICLVFAGGASAQSGAGAQAASGVATPHLANGQPDFSGMWNGRNGRGGGGGGEDGEEGGGGGDAVPAEGIHAVITSRRCAPNETPCDEQTNQTVDGEFTGRMNANRPLYKPEFWDKVQSLDVNTNTKDPVLQCQPLGIPRVGPPTKIMQNDKEVVFFYNGGGTQPQDFRIIPTDGRAHDPIRSQDVLYYGDSVGHWEGDTLVIDSVGFNDTTWLDKGGYFHSDLMHVIEKLHRDGNTLTYAVTVDDPQVLLKPWNLTPRALKLNLNPKAMIYETSPCREEDQSNISVKIHH